MRTQSTSVLLEVSMKRFVVEVDGFPRVLQDLSELLGHRTISHNPGLDRYRDVFPNITAEECAATEALFAVRDQFGGRARPSFEATLPVFAKWWKEHGRRLRLEGKPAWKQLLMRASNWFPRADMALGNALARLERRGIVYQDTVYPDNHPVTEVYGFNPTDKWVVDSAA